MVIVRSLNVTKGRWGEIRRKLSGPIFYAIRWGFSSRFWNLLNIESINRDSCWFKVPLTSAPGNGLVNVICGRRDIFPKRETLDLIALHRRFLSTPIVAGSGISSFVLNAIKGRPIPGQLGWPLSGHISGFG